MDFSSIYHHPDQQEIIDKLITGSDPRSITDWLKLKYTDKDQQHLRLSIKILKDFQSSPYMDKYEQVKQDLVAVKNGQAVERKLAASILNNKTYQERLQEVVEEKLELPKRFQAIDVLLRARIEQIFDKIQQNPEGTKADYALLKYIEQSLSLLEKYDKCVNNRPDQLIQHNYTIAYVDEYGTAMQEAMRETLAEIDQEAAFLFMEKWAQKKDSLRRPEPPSENKLLQEAKKLEEQIIQDSIHA